MYTKLKTISEAEAALLPYVPLIAQLTGKDTTLTRIVPLMELVGNPHQKLRTIHIAGTSGKTSTSYYIAALIRASGKKVGLTVSPHVDKITERVQLDGKPMSEAAFCSELSIFLDLIKDIELRPSYFELLYAFSLWVFERAGVDYAVVETGMGGLHDATNVITRADKVCVITDIGFDHMHILGNTLEEITAQKIGIVHKDNQVFMYEQSDVIMEVAQGCVKSQGAILNVTSEAAERSAYMHDIASMPLYQQHNFLLAHAVYLYLKDRDSLETIPPERLDAIQLLQVPGRMDTLKIGDKTLVMDGAHNAQKMATFVTSFQEKYPGFKPTVLVGLKHGKDYEGVAPILASFASTIIVTIFNATQDLPVAAIEPDILSKAFRKAGAEHVSATSDQHEAYTQLLASPEPMIVITGSFYLLSQIREKEGII